jgi:phage tail P2-like protein
MKDLLPNNATPQEKALSLTAGRFEDFPTNISQTVNPDACDAKFLPWLGWAYDVENWDSNWSEIQKRRIIREQFEIHQHKGTANSVKKLANSFGTSVSITEWWQTNPQGSPYTFNIYLSVPTTDVDTQASIVRAVTLNKPVRSSMTMIVTDTSICEFDLNPIFRVASFFRYTSSLI